MAIQGECMRYKIEGDFKIKKHRIGREDCYSVVIGCGDAFLVSTEDFYQMTDVGDFYLVQEHDEYFGISKDLMNGTLRRPSLEKLMALSGKEWIKLSSGGSFKNHNAINVLKSYLQESYLQNEPPVSLVEFSNFSNRCYLINNVDGSIYLHSWHPWGSPYS